MRFAIGVVLALAAAVPATACNSEFLTLIDWQAEKLDHPLLPYKLTAQVQYDGPKPYRMIHAGVMIDDVLGANIGQVNLERDGSAAPGGVVVADAQVTAKERLATINRDDTRARTCVWSIVYADGEVVEFE